MNNIQIELNKILEKECLRKNNEFSDWVLKEWRGDFPITREWVCYLVQAKWYEMVSKN